MDATDPAGGRVWIPEKRIWHRYVHGQPAAPAGSERARVSTRAGDQPGSDETARPRWETIRDRLAGISRPSAQANVPGSWWQMGYSTRFWLLLVPAALVSGAVASGLKLLLRQVEHLDWAYRAGEMTNAVGATSDVHRLASLLVAGAMAGGIWWAMKRYTGTTGGGLNGTIWAGKGEMDTGQSVASAGLSMTIIAMGASIGREQPPKEAAAALVCWLSRFGRLTPSERCLLMACAAGGAWGAVYNIPFGGGLFAAEVLMGSLALPIVVPALAVSVIATTVSWTVLSVHPYYQAIPTYTPSTTLLVWAVLAGPLLGTMGMAFVWLLGLANLRRARGNWVLVAPLVAFGLLGLLSFAYPQLLGNGRDLSENAFLGGFGVTGIAALMCLKPLVTAMSWGSGASGGMFTPTTSYGALVGALLGHLWSLVWPGSPAGAYALVGATAVLAAAMAAPLSAVVLMIELTRHLPSLIVPVLLAVGGATVTARLAGGGSIYSVRLPLDEPASRWAGSGRWPAGRTSGR